MADEKEKLWNMYNTMLRIRRFEERVGDAVVAGAMPGFVHLSIGQEAVAVGMIHDLRKDDFISSTHRGHGELIAKGMAPKEMFAELMGKVTGVCKGKGGSMHLGDLSLGIYPNNGILGSAAPIATGSALAMKMKGTDQVHVCFFGDGQANLGSIHEALNFAGVHKLPIVFVCENNQYAVSVPQSRSTSVEDVADRAAGYGFPGLVVDGQDVTAVYEVAREAIKRARGGEGPSLIECKTLRFRGHYEGDAETYRSHEEIERARQRDPLDLFEKRLRELGILTDEIVQEMSAQVNKEIEEAYAAAEADPMPSLDEVTADVLA
jgi:TPP-dependent pyruvate/acetoin dehydrogenase alpha subunit